MWQTDIDDAQLQINLGRQLEQADSCQEASTSIAGFIGSSQAMQKVYQTIAAVAPTNANVFIHGESGTGKEVCAHAIHSQSRRADHPFVVINCAAIPKDLLESEIFGHMKGSFTGVVSTRKGAAAQADGGTLFFDELYEMDLELQKKLLRFIQTSCYTPLGDHREYKVDVRIVCATNRDPLQAVQQGLFRADLYYRVYTIPIHMPPLRAREQDILKIATKLLLQYSQLDQKAFIGFTPEATALLLAYDWPGNVRELQNVIRQVVVLFDDRYVQAAYLTDLISTSKHLADVMSKEQGAETQLPSQERPQQSGQIRPMWQVEQDTILQAIAFCQGNIHNAAALLELSPSTIYRKKQAWEGKHEYEKG